jgi:hypothetical protein
MADELNHILNQSLRVRAGNQNIAGDLEFQIEEMGFAGEVGDRLFLGGPSDQFAKGRQMLRIDRAFIIRIKLDPRNRQYMSQQQFGGKPGRIDSFAREERGRPFEKPADRPCPIGFGHRQNIVHELSVSRPLV